MSKKSLKKVLTLGSLFDILNEQLANKTVNQTSTCKKYKKAGVIEITN